MQPFGFLLLKLSELFNNNYGWALVAFTIIVKTLMIPLSVKQQKSMLETQKIQPLLAAIQAKYKNDKEKLSAETMKLYKEHNVNPAGGCLPLLIQFPIIIILYQVITKPLTHMFNMTPDLINQLKTLVGIDPTVVTQEIDIAKKITMQIIQMPEFANLKILDFNFMWLDLSSTPSFSQPSVLWIIPVLAAASTYYMSKLSSAQSASSASQSENPTAASMNTMMKIMPLMTAWFTFSFPAGIGLYWVLSNVVQIGQQYFINLFLKKDPLVIEQPKKGGKN